MCSSTTLHHCSFHPFNHVSNETNMKWWWSAAPSFPWLLDQGDVRRYHKVPSCPHFVEKGEFGLRKEGGEYYNLLTMWSGGRKGGRGRGGAAPSCKPGFFLSPFPALTHHHVKWPSACMQACVRFPSPWRIVLWGSLSEIKGLPRDPCVGMVEQIWLIFHYAD